MLVTSQETKKSVLEDSKCTGSHKPYLRSTSIQCYLCLLLNSHFLTEAGIHVFILGCIGAGLPKTEANWQHVISDLKRIEDLIQSIDMDATLYTESSAHPSCKVTAMKCFLLELHVILHESRNSDINDTVENLIILANSSLSSIEIKKKMYERLLFVHSPWQ
ncbi:interleukin-15 isoform X3 [Neophocaena asiaeorientalis asiaeorientalis]|uniref:Interleukin n=1 Tax=Neophocaena asiaeorientalis asiaeorientalis TaxID=1706337 RepID=A0A341ARM4_NEOAA|nr:interleukin-15 isoform X3 [Neophocaena asiaeorientalis asiaeorientalis]XP_032489594.1 interleukin-15 isoform X3 [Phocoena sinus]